jgi:RimJ/RimL family protein N-acetyltransferase
MFREDDFESYARICADEEVMRYLGGKTFSPLEAWRHMAFLIGHWQLLGYGHWAVEEKATGAMIGRLGFLNPVGWPGFEIGWTLGRDSWGKGYATEGARRALRYAFTELDRDHVISLIHPENRASIRVAERLGEKPEGKAEILGIKVVVYGIDRDDWQDA